jgi:hypothetical protein
MATREDLRQGSKKSDKIVRLIRDNMDMSWRTMSENYPIWDSIESTYRIYRPSDDEDRDSLAKYGVQKIIVPIQFATLQVMTTFMMEIFTALNPILRLRGADPASVRCVSIMTIEAIVVTSCCNNGFLMHFVTALESCIIHGEVVRL